MPIEVIHAGYGRTGTHSLKAALEQLGYGPCYSMLEFMETKPGLNDGHVDRWHDFVCRGQAMDWNVLFADYRACVDTPTSYHYEEVARAFPNALVVVTIRDPESWYASWVAFHDVMAEVASAARDVSQDMIKLGEIIRAHRSRVWGLDASREEMIAQFERRVEEVSASVTSDRFLAFDVREGWRPLCSFLQQPVPDTPFPHVNEQDALREFLGRWAR
jgi:hypothetical protein